MCGIAGVYLPDRHIERRSLSRMAQVLAHRGPDGEQLHIEPGVGLAFRRLSIIDVAGGMQPLSNHDDTVWLVFNGEIYNHLELRAQLVSAGFVFKTNTDSESILHAYQAWGMTFIEKLRGIFAFAIWDRNQRRLVLGRDHSGVKPLFVRRESSGVRFASECKALLLEPAARQGLDLVGLAGDTSDGHFRRSAFVGISELAPGCIAWFGFGESGSRRYWSYEPTLDLHDERTDSDWVKKFRAELTRAVNEQVMSDVPIGAYLSGGIDSSAVVALMKKSKVGKIRTYTTVNSQFGDDAKYAASCAKFLGVSSRMSAVPGPEAFCDSLRYLTWISEAGADVASATRYWLASAASRDGVKVILTGQGIDEILTGYFPSFRSFLLTSARSRLGRQADPISWNGSYLSDAYVSQYLRGAAGTDELNSSEAALATREGLVLWHDRLATGLLPFEDRMGMAAGVEIRVPLLDHLLIEFVASMPQTTRAKLLSGKELLRRACRGLLPRDILTRRKFAFNATLMPVVRTIETALPNSESARWLNSLLAPDALKAKGYFDPQVVSDLRNRGDYLALDALLHVQLLDELFVKNFDPSIANEKPAFNRERASSGATTKREARTKTKQQASLLRDHRPEISPSVARIVSNRSLDMSKRHLDIAPAKVEFVEFGREGVSLPHQFLALLDRVNGQLTWSQIAEGLSISIAEVEAVALALEKFGVVSARTLVA